MKEKLLFIVFIFSIIAIKAKCQNSEVLELRKEGDNFIRAKHELGVFLFGFNPIMYNKTKKHIEITAIVSYANEDLYSYEFDTLIKSIGNVRIYSALLDTSTSQFYDLTFLTKTDCNGMFNIKFERKSNKYIILESEGRTTTGFNTLTYFNVFKKRYKTKLTVKTPCEN